MDPKVHYYIHKRPPSVGATWAPEIVYGHGSWWICDLFYFNISVEHEIIAWQPCEYFLSFGIDGGYWWPLELDLC